MVKDNGIKRSPNCFGCKLVSASTRFLNSSKGAGAAQLASDIIQRQLESRNPHLAATYRQLAGSELVRNGLRFGLGKLAERFAPRVITRHAMGGNADQRSNGARHVVVRPDRRAERSLNVSVKTVVPRSIFNNVSPMGVRAAATYVWSASDALPAMQTQKDPYYMTKQRKEERLQEGAGAEAFRRIFWTQPGGGQQRLHQQLLFNGAYIPPPQIASGPPISNKLLSYVNRLPYLAKP